MKNLKTKLQEINYSKILTYILFSVLFVQDIFAQGPPPPPTPTPIDGGVVALIIGAVAYGGSKLYKSTND